MSRLQKYINRLVIMIVAGQLILCTLIAILTRVWFSTTAWDEAYMNLGISANRMSLVSFFTYFLLTNTFLPISLPVQLEVTKVVQQYFINNDIGMYSYERDQLVECKSAPLVEEIGQISYVFSDKTGTLTRNVMEFKYMLVGNEFYGDKKKFENGANNFMAAIDDEDLRAKESMKDTETSTN